MSEPKRFSPGYMNELVELVRNSQSTCRQIDLEVRINPRLLTRWVWKAETDGAPTACGVARSVGPIASSNAIVRATQCGAPNVGRSVPATCVSSHAPIRYSAVTRSTLRRLGSARNLVIGATRRTRKAGSLANRAQTVEAGCAGWFAAGALAHGPVTQGSGTRARARFRDQNTGWLSRQAVDVPETLRRSPCATPRVLSRFPDAGPRGAPAGERSAVRMQRQPRGGGRPELGLRLLS